MARRYSGGGAVFQDHGNTNYTFVTPARYFSKERNNRIVIEALRSFGLDAVASGRNDILIDGRKVGHSVPYQRTFTFHFLSRFAL